jgi:hypothetical protein
MGVEAEVITHSFVVQDATVTQQGFGIGLIAAVHNYWPELVRTFNDASELTKAPYSVPVTSPVYLRARSLKSQTPSPPSFKIGKLTGTFSQTVSLTVAAPTAANEQYRITVDGIPVLVTSAPPATADTVASLLAVALNAITDVTATATGAVIALVSDTASVVHAYTGISGNIQLMDTTAAPSVLPSADLTAIRSYDGDWYGLDLVTPGKLAQLDAAAWAESEVVLYLAQTADTDVPAPGSTTDVASTAMASGYHRSSWWYHQPAGEPLTAGLLGVMLPKLPGPATWANKEIAAITKVPYNATTRGTVKAKSANYYTNMKGNGWTLYGWAASGRFLDITVAIDWFTIGVQTRVILLLGSNDVVPYTTAGIELVRTQILAQIQEGIAQGLIDGEQDYAVTAPALGAIDPNLKRQRILPDMRYSYCLSGAIHHVRIEGTVQV